MKGMAGQLKSWKALVAENEAEFANQPNSFFSRFEDGSKLEHDAIVNILKSVVPVQLDRIDVSFEQVRNAFKKLNQRKATGPDNLSALI